MSSSTRVVPSAEPNVTPMIDVLLVLLIVFMVAVVQVHRSMDVVLPEACDDVMSAMDVAKSAGVKVIGIMPRASSGR
jgi:biopolymer transport protein ExbD